MTDPQRKYLIDVSEAIQHIESFIEIAPGLEEYKSNLLVRRAVERELEIIGEAINQLLHTDSPPDILNASRIVDMRNRVIHGYDTVDDAIIWGILQRYIPELKEQVYAVIGINPSFQPRQPTALRKLHLLDHLSPGRSR